MILTSFITMVSIVGLTLRELPESGQKVRCFKKFFSLFFVTLSNGRDYATGIAIKWFEFRNFHIVGYRKGCSCASTFNFDSAPPGGATTECWIWKCNELFSSPLSRATGWTDQSEGWQGRVNYESTLAWQKWRDRWGVGIGSPKFQKKFFIKFAVVGGPILRAKFQPHRCKGSPMRGEKTQNRPLSNWKLIPVLCAVRNAAGNYARVIFHQCAGTPPLGRLLWVWHAGWYRWLNRSCQILC